jgi:hypothetical protein
MVKKYIMIVLTFAKKILLTPIQIPRIGKSTNKHPSKPKKRKRITDEDFVLNVMYGEVDRKGIQEGKLSIAHNKPEAIAWYFRTQLSLLPLTTKNIKRIKRFLKVSTEEEARDSIMDERALVLGSPETYFKNAEEHVAYVSKIVENENLEARDLGKLYVEEHEAANIDTKMSDLKFLKNFDKVVPRTEVVSRDRQGSVLTDTHAWAHLRPSKIKRLIVIDLNLNSTGFYSASSSLAHKLRGLLCSKFAVGFSSHSMFKYLYIKPLDKRPRGFYLPGPIKQVYSVQYKTMGKNKSKPDYVPGVVAEYNDGTFNSATDIKECLTTSKLYHSNNSEIKRSILLYLNAFLVFKDLWSIEITEADETLIFAADSKVIKKLCDMRDNPTTDSGNRKAVLHTVSSHKRTLKTGGSTTIKRYLRGIYTFELRGYVVKVAPPAFEFKDHSEKRIAEFKGTMAECIYRNIPEDILVNPNAKYLQASIALKPEEYKGYDFTVEKVLDNLPEHAEETAAEESLI